MLWTKRKKDRDRGLWQLPFNIVREDFFLNIYQILLCPGYYFRVEFQQWTTQKKNPCPHGADPLMEGERQKVKWIINVVRRWSVLSRKTEQKGGVGECVVKKRDYSGNAWRRGLLGEKLLNQGLMVGEGVMWGILGVEVIAFSLPCPDPSCLVYPTVTW